MDRCFVTDCPHEGVATGIVMEPGEVACGVMWPPTKINVTFCAGHMALVSEGSVKGLSLESPDDSV